MCAIRISPEVPTYIASCQQDLRKGQPTLDPIIARGDVYVWPVGKPDSYVVFVHGFPHEPGGIIEASRLTPSHQIDNMTITTGTDKQLSDTLGVTKIVIDGVVYEATNGEEH